VSDESVKPVHWIASSQDDLGAFPKEVRRAVGYALFRAQEGKRSPDAKPLKGVVKGPGVLEIVEDHEQLPSTRSR
jgi:phage-related protein